MESAPRFVLPPRPTPPDAGSREHERWCRDLTLKYEGGTITSAYGNFVQLWASGELPSATNGKDINRKAYKAKRTNKIGGDEKEVSVPAKTYKKYPSQRASQAAGGEVITFDTRDGIFTARMTGDIQHLIKQIASDLTQQYMEFTLYSARGADYGPFVPLTILS